MEGQKPTRGEAPNERESASPAQAGPDLETLHTEGSVDGTQPAERPAVDPAPAAPAFTGGPSLGRYALREELGRGGMGVVYRAFDPALGRDVAIKFLVLSSALSERGRQRFQREARTVARLEHPHIVRVYDTGTRDGLDYLVMRLVRGPSLARRLEQGPFPEAQAIPIAVRLAGALHYAHRQGLVHRDVKPGNVLMDEEDQPVLTDFGVVKDLSDASPGLTADSRLLGTPAYMAPEQLRLGAQVGPAADQYALGIVLYEMLTGSRPAGTSSSALEDAPPSGAGAASPPDGTDTVRPRKTTARAAPLPAPLERVCRKALAEDPAERYPSLEAFAEDLERYLRGEPVSARPPGVLRRLRLLARARPGALLATLLAVLVLVTAAGAATATWIERRKAARLEAAADDRLNATEARIDALVQEGRTSDADAAFAAFTALDDNRDTRALARAWLHQAERLRARDATAEEGRALASAYTTAIDLRERGDALRALARYLRRTWAWDSLEEQIDTALERVPALLEDPELARLRAEAAFARLDFRAALEAPTGAAADPLQALARAFSHATRTGHVYESSRPVILTDPEDGSRALYLFPMEGTLTPVLALDAPTLPQTAQLTFADGSTNHEGVFPLQAGPGQPAQLALWDRRAQTAALYQRHGETLEPLYRWPSSAIGGAVSADLDGDGSLELYIATEAYQRDLRALRRLPSGMWTMSDAHPPTSRMNSDLSGLVLTDLDRDGRPELTLAAGAWSAYDVRLLEAGDGGKLALRDRLKLGTIDELAVLPDRRERLVAAKQDLYPNPVMFSPEHPLGEPGGLYILSHTDKGLAIDQRLPFPQRDRPLRIIVGDLDGNGFQDVVLSEHDSDPGFVSLFLQRPDGTFEEQALRGAAPLGVANLDEDPADELIVTIAADGHRIWVLGAGEERAPVLERSRRTRDVPSRIAPGVAEAWIQAEDLAAIGMMDSAVDRLRRIAELTLDADTIAAARLRAADLLKKAERPREAARLYEEAAEQPSGRSRDALAGAEETWRSLNAFDAARRMVERLLELPGLPAAERTRWEDERAWLQTQLDPSRSWRIDFSTPPEDGWRFTNADALRWQRSAGTLRMDLVRTGPDELLARLPVHWDGERLTLEAEVTLERLEWAAGIAIRLRSEAGMQFGIFAVGWGGQYSLHQQIGCNAANARAAERVRVDGPGTPRRAVVRLDELEPGRFRCLFADPDTGEVLWEDAWIGPRPAAGRWYLELGGDAEGEVVPQRARAAVHSIRLQGVERADDDEAASPWQDALRMLVNGAPKRLLEALPATLPGVSPVDLQLLRYRAFQDLGRPLEAEAALHSALEAGLARDPAARTRLVALVREHPEQLNPLLQEMLGWDAWLEIFAKAWAAAAKMHTDDPLVHDTLVLSLGRQVLTRAPRGGVLELANLLQARARGGLSTGQWGAARADLARALELLEAAGASGTRDEQLRVDARRLASLCHSLLAEVELTAGDRDASLAQVKQAIEASPQPEITVDLLKALPSLEPLHAHPEWQRLMAGPHE